MHGTFRLSFSRFKVCVFFEPSSVETRFGMAFRAHAFLGKTFRLKSLLASAQQCNNGNSAITQNIAESFRNILTYREKTAYNESFLANDVFVRFLASRESARNGKHTDKSGWVIYYG